MDIIRKSPHTGNLNVMNIDVTTAQIERYERGEGYIQDIFSSLNADEREFIKTGYTPNDWREIFGD